MTNPHQKKAKQKQEETKDTLDRPLRDREEQFCRQIVLGKTNGDAYLNAGYKAKNKVTASNLASRLLKNERIISRRLLRKVHIQPRGGAETITNFQSTSWNHAETR